MTNPEPVAWPSRVVTRTETTLGSTWAAAVLMADGPIAAGAAATGRTGLPAAVVAASCPAT